MIAANTAYSLGGGCYEPFIVNNSLIVNNTAGNCGGVYSSSTLNNCTVANNTGGGIMGVDHDVLHLYANNCIVWGNSGWQWQSSAVTHFQNSCCSTAGEGITVTSDPLFTDAFNRDFRLQPASPCIDAGENSLVKGAADLAGGVRVMNNIVDMGAYESLPFVQVIFDVAPGVFVGLGTNRLDAFIPRTNLVYGSYIPTNEVFRTGHLSDGWFSLPAGAGCAIHAETPFVNMDAHSVYPYWRQRGLMLLLR